VAASIRGIEFSSIPRCSPLYFVYNRHIGFTISSVHRVGHNVNGYHQFRVNLNYIFSEVNCPSIFRKLVGEEKP
jgi:hypothetical protein